MFSLVGGHTGQIIASHLTAALYNHTQVALVPILPADEIGDGGAVGDGAVTVAELPVIETLEAGVGVVVGDGEGVHKAVGGLNGLPEEAIKPILVYTAASDGTAKTAQAPSREGELAQIDHPAVKGQSGAEISDHVGQVFILRGAVGDDDHVLVRALGRLGKGGLVDRLGP